MCNRGLGRIDIYLPITASNESINGCWIAVARAPWGRAHEGSTHILPVTAPNESINGCWIPVAGGGEGEGMMGVPIYYQ